MFAQENHQSVIRILSALRLVGIIGGSWAILTILSAVFAYLPGHPHFSLFSTYLSDIGDTPGWPQIILTWAP